MKRQAILIGAPEVKTSKKYLQGVDLDIHNYINFLQSPLGGAWDKKEINAIKNPDKESLIKLIHSVNTDYLLIVFSGNGYFALSGKTTFSINKTEHITLEDIISLTSTVSKAMFVLDTCRNFVDSNFSNFLGEKALSFPANILKEQSRILFESQLKKCEDGIAFFYSCAIGETSIDTNNGGCFTTSLLYKAQEWAAKQDIDSVLTIDTAFGLAKNHISTYITKNQSPQLRLSNQRRCWFPFAIR